MRSQKSFKNLIAAIISQIITLAIGIILPRVIILAYGSEVNGLLTAIKQFIYYLTFVEAGLSGACIFSLYKPLAFKEIPEINKILSSARKLYFKSGVLFTILSIILALSFPFIVKAKNIESITVSVLVLIMGINGALEFFSMGKYRALLTADQKSYVIYIIQTISIIVNATIIVLLAGYKYPIIWVQLFASISYLVRTLLLNVYVRKHYSFINFKISNTQNVLHQRWDVVFHQFASLIVFNTPIVLMTLLGTLTQVSVYSLYSMVFLGLNGIIATFSASIVSGMGELISKGEKIKLMNTYKEYEYLFYMVITFIFTVTSILIVPFIRIYTVGIKDTNYVRPDIALVMIAMGCLNSYRLPQIALVNSAGHYRETRARVMVEVLINVTASVVLGLKFGIVGILLGTVCSHFYRVIDLAFYIRRIIPEITAKSTLLRQARASGLIVLIAVPIYKIIDTMVNNIYQLLLYGTVISIATVLITGVINYIFEPKSFESVKHRVVLILFKSRTKQTI